ncbi:MAG TPA: N-acetyltransferase [Pseudonocardiaceae bacterium]
MDLICVTLAERPDLADRLWDLSDQWPTFMLHDPVAGLYYNDAALDTFAEHVLLVLDREDSESLVARGFSVPFVFDGPVEELPDGGWDWVVVRASTDHWLARPPTMVSALEITVRSDLRGQGLSALVLDAMRRNVARLGFSDLVAPVRPNAKHREPELAMIEYLARTRADGLPADPWLRVHVRAGGRVVKVAHCSMTITASLERWREWTGLPFDRQGPVRVPGALVPVECDLVHERAVYVEPNVWVHHRLTTGGTSGR